MREVVWRNRNHMRIHTGHRTFDRQTELITTGNVIGTTQFSSYIRTHGETECNWTEFPKGQLQDYDLGHFKDFERRWPHHRRRVAKLVDQAGGGILYEFRSWRRRAQSNVKVVHAYVLTDQQHRLLWARCVGPTWKSRDIMAECIPYVADLAADVMETVEENLRQATDPHDFEAWQAIQSHCVKELTCPQT